MEGVHDVCVVWSMFTDLIDLIADLTFSLFPFASDGKSRKSESSCIVDLIQLHTTTIVGHSSARQTSQSLGIATIPSTSTYHSSTMTSSSPSSRPRKALIIGAGPVGSLTALSLHKRGWQVEVWEGRDGEYLLDLATMY
jgi:hypothetical protein